MNTTNQRKFDRSKKIRTYALSSYVCAPLPLLLSEPLGRGITYGLIVSLIVTGFTLSSQYLCPVCNHTLKITTHPNKLKHCPNCKTDLSQYTNLK